MNMLFTKLSIKQWCGANGYQKGERLSQSGKVDFSLYDVKQRIFIAQVDGPSQSEVRLTVDLDGMADARCSCPTLHSQAAYCHHIAAVLLRIYEIQQGAQDTPDTLDTLDGKLPTGAASGNVPMALEPSPTTETDEPVHIAERILDLFNEPHARPMLNRTLVDTREPLEIHFILKVLEVNSRTSMLAIELKVGPKQVYVVHDLPTFLARIEHGEVDAFSPRFSYDPELHTFAPDNEAVLRMLIDIVQNHAQYQQTTLPSQASAKSKQRRLVIPPRAWPELLSLLMKAPFVTLRDGQAEYSSINLSEAPLPLRFSFDEPNAKQYALHVTGLEELTVLEPYGYVLYQGTLHQIKEKQGSQLAELRDIVTASGVRRIPIPRERIEAFMEQAVPGLKRLGTVSIAPAVAQRISHAPLQARLYLDRVKDRLLASLEYQYGEVITSPFHDMQSRQGADHRIVIRDTEQEQKIEAIIENSSFTKTEAGYFISDEEAEFNFLYTVLPQLKTMVKVYATTAVKLRVYNLRELPKAHVHVSADERLNWLEFKLKMGWIPESEIRGLIRALTEKRRYYALPNGSLLPLENDEMQALNQFLEETGLLSAHFEHFGEAGIRVPLMQGISLTEHEYRGLKLDKPVRQLLDNLRHPDNLNFPIPEPLTHVLRDYQRFGYQWLKTIATYGFGGILADDMGLGKTLQAITFIASVLPEIRQRSQPALVIAPGALMYNWLNELRKFTPHMRTVIADGTPNERKQKLSKLAEVDVVITSYPLLLRDVEQYKALSFHTLILDEAQAFKNHTTKTARAVQTVRADHRFALTGTPIENRLEELWSIMRVVFPPLLQDLKTFANWTSKEVARRARPFMLRRWKHDVLDDLPEKVESIIPTELLPEQKKIYTAYLAKLKQETLKHLAEDGWQKHRIKILAGLTRLRQICCHPALFVEGYEGGSAKLEQLREIVLEGVASRKRMLIFSQFTSMLRLIGEVLHEEGLPFFYLDGSTPSRERVELCDRFNDGEMELFLISMKAGGTGLNLTGADTVILYDLWWNPAVEDQAADRAHRIGQKNTVQVIRLIARDTMEEKMYELQHRKRHLIDEVTGLGEHSQPAWSEEELREILRL